MSTSKTITPSAKSRKVEAEVRARIPTMAPSQDYTLEKILTDVTWSQLEKRDRIAAGLYISGLVATGEIPLRRTGNTACNKARYRRP